MVHRACREVFQSCFLCEETKPRYQNLCLFAAEQVTSGLSGSSPSQQDAICHLSSTEEK